MAEFDGYYRWRDPARLSRDEITALEERDPPEPESGQSGYVQPCSLCGSRRGALRSGERGSGRTRLKFCVDEEACAARAEERHGQ